MINNNIIIITLSLYTYLGKISPGYVSFSMDFAQDFSWIFTYRDLTILPI
ncbi:hypothetical protein [Klebsiella phage vB_KvaS_F2M1D]|nr:hypothetical protein [Klebsiella phage vB_KvaS_F2M1D]